MSDVTDKKRPEPFGIEDCGCETFRIYGPDGAYLDSDAAEAYMDAIEAERDAARVACALSCTLHACYSAECAAHVLLEDGRKIVAERDALKARVEKLEKGTSVLAQTRDILLERAEQAEADLAREKELNGGKIIALKALLEKEKERSARLIQTIGSIHQAAKFAEVTGSETNSRRLCGQIREEAVKALEETR